MADYYEILGVSRDATKEEIKKRYKELAKKYHPDFNKDPGAEEKFKEISEAASVLLDDEKRKQYDQFGSTEGFESGFDFNDFAQNFGFDDFFSDIFRNFGFNFGGRGFRRGFREEGERYERG